MRHLEITRTVTAAPEQVWSVLADFGQIGLWNPNLSGSHLLAGSPSEGVGATRQCDMSDGKNWIRERVTDWDPGRSYSVDIYEGSMPLKVARATLGVRDLGGGRSEAYMLFDYTPKLGLVGRVMDAVMLKSMMEKSIRRLLEGLEHQVGAQAA